VLTVPKQSSAEDCEMTGNNFVFRDNYSRNKENEAEDLEIDENITYQTVMEAHSKKHSKLLKIATALFLILFILLTVLIFKSRNSADKKQVATIEKRLDRLEAEFTSLKTYIASKLDQAIKEMERDRRPPTEEQASPEKTPPPVQNEQKNVNPKVHKVLPGESLARISRYYGLSVRQLRDYNNLGSNSIIYPGQELKLTP
jgi:LysM repeat protein